MRNDRANRWSLFSCLLSVCLASCAAPEVVDSKPGPARPLTDRKVSVLVAHYSLRGNTEKMAQAVVEGARRVKGAAVKLKKVDRVTKEDLEAADAIILGCPIVQQAVKCVT